MTTTIRVGDALTVLKTLPSESVHMCVTSPPYFGLRRYIDDDSPEKQFEIGLEATPELWCAAMVAVFREVRRVLRPDGTVWVNVGDSYAGSQGNGYKQTLDKTNRSGWQAARSRSSGDLLSPRDSTRKGSVYARRHCRLCLAVTVEMAPPPGQDVGLCSSMVLGAG